MVEAQAVEAHKARRCNRPNLVRELARSVVDRQRPALQLADRSPGREQRPRLGKHEARRPAGDIYVVDGPQAGVGNNGTKLDRNVKCLVKAGCFRIPKYKGRVHQVQLSWMDPGGHAVALTRRRRRPNLMRAGLPRLVVYDWKSSTRDVPTPASSSCFIRFLLCLWSPPAAPHQATKNPRAEEPRT